MLILPGLVPPLYFAASQSHIHVFLSHEPRINGFPLLSWVLELDLEFNGLDCDSQDENTRTKSTHLIGQ